MATILNLIILWVRQLSRLFQRGNAGGLLSQLVADPSIRPNNYLAKSQTSIVENFTFQLDSIVKRNSQSVEEVDSSSGTCPICGGLEAAGNCPARLSQTLRFEIYAQASTKKNAFRRLIRKEWIAHYSGEVLNLLRTTTKGDLSWLGKEALATLFQHDFKVCEKIKVPWLNLLNSKIKLSIQPECFAQLCGLEKYELKTFMFPDNIFAMFDGRLHPSTVKSMRGSQIALFASDLRLSPLEGAFYPCKELYLHLTRYPFRYVAPKCLQGYLFYHSRESEKFGWEWQNLPKATSDRIDWSLVGGSIHPEDYEFLPLHLLQQLLGCPDAASYMVKLNSPLIKRLVLERGKFAKLAKTLPKVAINLLFRVDSLPDDIFSDCTAKVLDDLHEDQGTFSTTMKRLFHHHNISEIIKKISRNTDSHYCSAIDSAQKYLELSWLRRYVTIECKRLLSFDTKDPSFTQVAPEFSPPNNDKHWRNIFKTFKLKGWSNAPPGLLAALWSFPSFCSGLNSRENQFFLRDIIKESLWYVGRDCAILMTNAITFDIAAHLGPWDYSLFTSSDLVNFKLSDLTIEQIENFSVLIPLNRLEFTFASSLSKDFDRVIEQEGCTFSPSIPKESPSLLLPSSSLTKRHLSNTNLIGHYERSLFRRYIHSNWVKVRYTTLNESFDSRSFPPKPFKLCAQILTNGWDSGLDCISQLKKKFPAYLNHQTNRRASFKALLAVGTSEILPVIIELRNSPVEFDLWLIVFNKESLINRAAASDDVNFRQKSFRKFVRTFDFHRSTKWISKNPKKVLQAQRFLGQSNAFLHNLIQSWTINMLENLQKNQIVSKLSNGSNSSSFKFSWGVGGETGLIVGVLFGMAFQQSITVPFTIHPNFFTMIVNITDEKIDNYYKEHYALDLEDYLKTIGTPDSPDLGGASEDGEKKSQSMVPNPTKVKPSNQSLTFTAPGLKVMQRPIAVTFDDHHSQTIKHVARLDDNSMKKKFKKFVESFVETFKMSVHLDHLKHLHKPQLLTELFNPLPLNCKDFLKTFYFEAKEGIRDEFVPSLIPERKISLENVFESFIRALSPRQLLRLYRLWTGTLEVQIRAESIKIIFEPINQNTRVAPFPFWSGHHQDYKEGCTLDCEKILEDDCLFKSLVIASSQEYKEIFQNAAQIQLDLIKSNSGIENFNSDIENFKSLYNAETTTFAAIYDISNSNVSIPVQSAAAILHGLIHHVPNDSSIEKFNLIRPFI